MAMRDGDDVKVDVVSEGEGKLIVRTPEGKEETYYQSPIRTMRLRAEELQVSCGAWAGGLSSVERLPTPQTYVSGTAHLESGSISVIGEPSNVAHKFRVSFRVYDPEEFDRYFKETGKHVYSTSVGFVRRDWEIGNDDYWFIEVRVTQQTMDAIVSALSSGSMQGMTLGLTLVNIYSDDNWAPPSVASDWFLRPSERDNSIRSPEMAHGEVAYLDMTLAKANLLPAAAPEDDYEDEEDEEEKPEPEPDMRALAIAAVGRKVEELQATVKVVGWVIAIALVVLVFKLH